MVAICSPEALHRIEKLRASAGLQVLWQPARIQDDTVALDAVSLEVRPGELFGHLADMFTQSRSMLAPRKLVVGLMLGIVGWGAEGYGLYLLCQALSVDLTVTAGVSIYATAVLAGAAAFFLPGGIGGTELVMSALLVHQGATLALALIATAICRTATLWFAVVLGFFSIFLVHAGVARPSARVSP